MAQCRSLSTVCLDQSDARESREAGKAPQILCSPGLCDAMFHLIRQNAAGSAYVLIRMLEVLSQVAEVERSTPRGIELKRHADLTMASARHGVADQAALADLEERYGTLLAAMGRS